MRGVLFLLNALILLESTKGTTYDDLDDHDKIIVNKAIEQANKDYGKGKHLDFHIIANRVSYLTHSLSFLGLFRFLVFCACT